MRIGVDITTLSEGNSGIQVYIKNVLNNLQDIDAINNYFLFEPNPSGYKIFNPEWRIITRRSIRFLSPRTFWRHKILPQLLYQYNIDVLWSPAFLTPLFIPKKVSVVVTIYDLTHFRYPDTMKMDRFHLLLHRLQILQSIKKAKVIITISSFIRKEIGACISYSSEKRIRVAPCGKPPWKFPYNYHASAREDFLFFAGNFEPRKNIITVIKALELLYQRGLSITLQLAGQPGWKNKEIHEYIARSPIRKNIIFLGYISEEQLINKYCTCKAMIFPSLYEGFGMPVLEALVLDCLVITSAGTVMKEVCGEAAIYCDPGDPHDMAAAIASLYRPEFDRNIFLRHRTQLLARYSWKESAKIILQELTDHAP